MREPHASLFRRIGLDLSPAHRVYASFFLYAFGMGGMFPRLGDIQRALGIHEGALGLALIGAAAGTLVSLSFAGRYVERLGHRRTLLLLIALLPVCYAVASLAYTPLMLFMLLLPAGVCIGAVEIVVNLEADRVEHQTGRRIMNRAHGFWSLGFFTAGAMGALMSHIGVSPQVHLIIAVPMVVVGLALALGRFDAAAHRLETSSAPAARFARPTWGVMLLVMVTLSAMVLEGAGAEWSAIYMRDVFEAGPFVCGFAVATGGLAQGITRFFADPFVERHQPVSVARVLLSVLGAGVVLVFVAPSMWLALLGFALMGVGTSVIFPLAMSAAAQRTDRAAATNVAALAQISFVAFLLGPPLLGSIAQAFGIRWSFGIGIPLVVLSFIVASALHSGPVAKKGISDSTSAG
jgi:MFS family permease